MAVIEIDGNLLERLETLITGQQGDLFLRLGPYSTLSYYLGSGQYGGLSGGNIAVPVDGDEAVTGIFDFASIIAFGASQMHPLTIRDIQLDAVDLFSLVSRTSTGAYVIFQTDAFIQALNAKAWEIEGHAGADRIAPSAYARLGKSDRIMALDGDDTVNGGLGSDTIDGGIGNDWLIGEAGADRLTGGIGADRLQGGKGADILTGGAGNDALGGGAGADVFVFTGNTGADRITGFEDGLDRIDLSGPYEVQALRKSTLVLHDGGSILLVGISASVIGADDFL